MSKNDKRKETSKSNIKKAQQAKAQSQREAKIEYLNKKKRLTKKEEEWLQRWSPKDEEKEDEVIEEKNLPKHKNEKPKYEIEEEDVSDDSSDEEIIIRPKTKRIIKEVIKTETKRDNLSEEINNLKELISSIAVRRKEKQTKPKQPQINILPFPTYQQQQPVAQPPEVDSMQKKILLNF
jgi:hypothetical protein